MIYLKYRENGKIVCKIKKQKIIKEKGYTYLSVEEDVDINTIYIEDNQIKQKSEFDFIVEKISDKLYLISNIPSNTCIIYGKSTYNPLEDSIEFEMDHPGDYSLYFKNVKYIDKEVFLKCP